MSELGKRILIIGSGGAGKSTLARQLGQITGLPVIHLDKEFWHAGWVQTPKEEWAQKQYSLMEGEEWILDGNYGGTMDSRLEKADTVFFLDIGRVTCAYSILKRWLANKGRVRPDMPEGCPESMDLEFFLWVWNFSKCSRPAILERLEKYKDKKIIILKSRRAVKSFVKELQR